MLQLAEENSGWRKNWGQTMAWIFISSGMFGKPKSEVGFLMPVTKRKIKKIK